MTKTFNLRSLFKTVICLAFIFGCTTSAVFACSCLPPSKSFLETLPNADLVVVGKSTSYHGLGASTNIPLAVDVEVQRVLKGNDASQKIRVFGDNGALCRPYVTKFPLNTIWVFALNLLPAGANGESQYYINNCAETYLPVGAGKVFGRIKSSQQTSMPLAKFVKSVRR